MHRARTFHGIMTRLALAAILLMALAPTVSRLVAGMTMPGLVEMCTPTGMQYVAAAALGGAAGKLPAQDHAGMDGDCGYCPLLAGTALLLLAFTWLLPGAPAAAPLPFFRDRPYHPSSVFPGRESRGPPLAL